MSCYFFPVFYHNASFPFLRGLSILPLWYKKLLLVFDEKNPLMTNDRIMNMRILHDAVKAETRKNVYVYNASTHLKQDIYKCTCKNTMSLFLKMVVSERYYRYFVGFVAFLLSVF